MAVLGVPGPSELDPDAPALDMALAILGQGLSSRLNQSVRERLKLVHGVSSGQFNGMSPGLIYLWAELEPAQVKAAVKAMWAEAERMKQELVTDEELARQRIKIEHEEASDLMSMEGMAGKLGYYECLGDYRLSDSLTQKMRSVSPKDVMRVMKKFFQASQASLVVYRPKDSRPTGLKAADWSKLIAGAAESQRACGCGPPGQEVRGPAPLLLRQRPEAHRQAHPPYAHRRHAGPDAGRVPVRP